MEFEFQNETNMKLTTVFCCFLIFGLVACKKDKSSRDYWGDISVLKNGAPWSGDIIALQHTFSKEKIDITIHVTTAEGLFLDNLLFFKIPKAVGKYKLSYSINQPPDDSLVGARYFQGYDDQLGDVYDLSINDSTSYLEITQYDAHKGEFWGTFNLALYRTLATSINAVDTLIFTNGNFHTRLDK